MSDQDSVADGLPCKSLHHWWSSTSTWHANHQNSSWNNRPWRLAEEPEPSCCSACFTLPNHRWLLCRGRAPLLLGGLFLLRAVRFCLCFFSPYSFPTSRRRSFNLCSTFAPSGGSTASAASSGLPYTADIPGAVPSEAQAPGGMLDCPLETPRDRPFKLPSLRRSALSHRRPNPPPLGPTGRGGSQPAWTQNPTGA